MKFRYARHTDKLKTITEFYTKVLGFKILGSFENHSKYNGVFLGLDDLDWHLEFTESANPAEHHPDADDLIVFYLNAQEEINTIKKKAGDYNTPIVKSKNPYWQANGIELRDPDNFGVILTLNSSSD